MKIAQKIQSKLRRGSVHLYREMRHGMGMDAAFYQQARGSRIVIYHGICLSDHTRFNPIFLKRNTFEQHLQYYKKHFNIVSLDGFYAGQFSADKFNICLTFDDGFANNYKYVLPLLEKYQVPAAFFITAICHAGYDILWNDFLNIASKYGPSKLVYKNEAFGKNKFGKYYSLNSGERLSDTLRSKGFEAKAEMMETLHHIVPFKNSLKDEDYWLQMSEKQIKALSASPYATIGSHGYYHNDLARISLADSLAEMRLSKSYLENLTQLNISGLAFPYGSYTPAVVNAAKQAGYHQLLAMDFLSAADEQDSALRERFTVNPFISTHNQMHATINRRYEM